MAQAVEAKPALAWGRRLLGEEGRRPSRRCCSIRWEPYQKEIEHHFRPANGNATSAGIHGPCILEGFNRLRYAGQHACANQIPMLPPRAGLAWENAQGMGPGTEICPAPAAPRRLAAAHSTPASQGPLSQFAPAGRSRHAGQSPCRCSAEATEVRQTVSTGRGRPRRQAMIRKSSRPVERGVVEPIRLVRTLGLQRGLDRGCQLAAGARFSGTDGARSSWWDLPR